MLQRLTLEQLHGDERTPVVFINVVDRANVRMIQGRRVPGLPLEALQVFAAGCDVFRQKLQRDIAAELRILSLVNDTHSAAPQLFDNPVMRNGFTDHSSASRAILV